MSSEPPMARVIAAMARASWLRMRSAWRWRARSTARPIWCPRVSRKWSSSSVKRRPGRLATLRTPRLPFSKRRGMGAGAPGLGQPLGGGGHAGALGRVARLHAVARPEHLGAEALAEAGALDLVE